MTLSLQRFSASIAGTPVLRSVSLDLPPAQTIALVGRNGAGKTTTLRGIMGLIEPTDGLVKLDAKNLTALQPHLRASQGIGYAPEERRLIPAFTVEENLMVPAWAQKLDSLETRQRRDLVHRVVPELRDIGERLGGLISGGQQKMVALGRALMSGTRYILLDEPFQGLAPALAARYGQALRELRALRPDLGIVVTESNPSLLIGLADQFVTMERGEIVSNEVAR